MTVPNGDTKQNVRTVGSNFTTFVYDGKAIAYLESIQDSGVKSLGGSEFIHPLGSRVPTDIVVSRVLDGGFLTLSIKELWHQEVWEQLSKLAGAKTIVDIFDRLAASPNYVTCTKIITPPNGKRYGKVYHRCVITEITDSESIAIGDLSVSKSISVAYTHSTAL